MPRLGRQPVSLSAQQQATLAPIKAELARIAAAIPRNARIVGPLNGPKLRAPLTSTDGRVLTWTKLLNVTVMARIEKCAAKRGLQPEIDGCWFIEKVRSIC